MKLLYLFLGFAFAASKIKLNVPSLKRLNPLNIIPIAVWKPRHLNLLDHNTKMVQFVITLKISFQTNFSDHIESILDDRDLISTLSRQWLDISSVDRLKIYELLRPTSEFALDTLERILKMDILDRPINEKYFLLCLCTMIIGRMDWNSLPFNFLYNLLRDHSDVVVDYIPDSTWLSLNIDRAERLLDLNIRSVSKHVQTLKFKFADDIVKPKVQVLSFLPRFFSKKFVYNPQEIITEGGFDQNSIFSMNISLVKSDYNRIKFKFSFDPRTRLIPEFFVSLETVDDSTVLSGQLIFLEPKYKSLVMEEISNGSSIVSNELDKFIDSRHLKHGSEYRLIFRLMRLTPINQ